MHNEKRTYTYDEAHQHDIRSVNATTSSWISLKDAYEERKAHQVQAEGMVELSFYNLFWIFMIASFFGLLVETIVSYPIDGLWKDRAGLVWGPFSPIYGLGGVLMTVGLNRMESETALHTFVFAGLLGASFEFCAGWFWQACFGIAAWDYSSQPFNLMGHTCLGIAIVWGALGLMWVKMLLPLAMDLISLIPHNIARALTIGCFIFMCVDIVVTIGTFDCWWERMSGIPVTTPFQEFFNTYFGTDFMEARFQTITILPDTAAPRTLPISL